MRPETPAELHQYIRTYCRTETGAKAIVPTRRICPGHNAPFEFVSDAFFGRHSKQIAKAPRSGGKTFDFGLIAFLGMYHLGRDYPLEVLNVGAIQDQARKCFDYSASLWRQPEFMHRAGRGGRGILKESIQLDNGTSLETTVATVSGVNGPHVPWLHLDEWELWDWAIGQQAFSIPQSAGPHRSAVRIASTQKYAYGNMQRFLEEAPARGFQVYKWCIWETIEQCRDRACSSCPIFQFQDREGGELCGGRARDARGYYGIDDFIDKAKSLDRRTLEEEWLCLRPSREGLVFGREYNEDVHRVRVEIPYVQTLPLQITIDQGFTNPFSVLITQVSPAAQLRIIGEVYQTETIPEDMARRTADLLEAMGVPAGTKIPLVFDPEDPGAARTFAKHCISSKKTRYNLLLRHPRGSNDLEDHLRLIRRRLKITPGVAPRVAISSAVKMLPYEMTQYHYPTPKGSDRPVTEKPVDKDNHGISAWYRLESFLQSPGKAQSGTAPIM